MNLVKWHGLGNDYLFLDTRAHPPADPAMTARVLSDRHRGPGADGLILLGHPSGADADVRLEIRNADGSDGGVCGNGTRCAAAWVVAEELVPVAGRIDASHDRVRLETPAGVTIADVESSGAAGWMVDLDLPSPRFDLVSLPAQVPGRAADDAIVDEAIPDLAAIAGLPESVRWSFVSTGNPHLVARCDDAVAIDAIDLARLGPILERHPWFPARVNVHLVADRGDRIAMRTWERGSGITQACGTGACAAVVAFVRAGRREPDVSHRVSLPAGDLEIAWSGDAAGSIRMRGEAVRVGSIEVDDRWIEEELRRRGDEIR